MSEENDDGNKKGLAWFAWLASAALVAFLAIVLITAGGNSDDNSAAAQPSSTTPAATTTDAGSGTAPAATTTAPTATTPIPAEVQNDPIVQRLAHGRSLPFTAGPWVKAAWRDAVYSRLRPATQQRAEKVAADGGFGILIQ